MEQKTNKDITISIITPSYNSAQYIAETIDSVLNQSYENWEMIIIDDVSTDISPQIVRDYSAKDPRIKLVQSDVNQGPAISRNIGIKVAEGRYIAFLDSDDTWNKDKLQLQYEILKDTDIALSYCSYECIDENSTPLNKIIRAKNKISYSDMLNFNHIGCLTAIYDTNIIGKVYFRNIGHEDYILWLDIIRKGYKTAGIDKVLANYRIRSGSVSNNKLKMTLYQWNIYRNIEKLNIIKASYHFIRYSINGINKLLS